MTFVAAHQSADYALLAADLRYFSGPGERFADLGGKLTWTDTGWAVARGGAGGRVLSVTMHMAALFSDGTADSFEHHYVQAAYDVFRSANPGVDMNTDALIDVLFASWDDGPVLHRLHVDYDFEWECEPFPDNGVAFGFPSDTVEVEDRHYRMLYGASGLGEGVRRTAEVFAEVTRESATVSPQMTVAALVGEEHVPERYTWTDDASALADRTPEELEDSAVQFRPPRRTESEVRRQEKRKRHAAGIVGE